MHLIAIGGSDAGISAALRARELDPDTEVTVVVADAYPNFSICGIPYYVSGEVTHWRNLAHRTIADLEATGMGLRLDTVARRIDVEGRKLLVTDADGNEELLPYDELVVGTGAVSVRPPIEGLSEPDALGVEDGVHLLHSMGDTFAVMRTLEDAAPASAIIVGAGYIGLEMAEALVARGLSVTQMEQLPEVLPTVDPEIGALVHAQLVDHGVDVLTGTTVRSVTRAAPGEPARLRVEATTTDGQDVVRNVDMVLVVVGVRPDTELAASAGATLGHRGAIAVDRHMRTEPPARLRRRRLRGDPSPTARRDLPAARHDRPQAGTGGRRERARRQPGLRRQPRHPGRQDLRSRRGPHRPARPRSRRGRVRSDDRRRRGRRPQGVLPRESPHRHALHGRRHDRSSPRCPALRAQARRGGQTSRHRCHRHLPRDDRGRHE